MLRLVILIVILPVTACGGLGARFSERDAIFVGYNTSRNAGAFVINGGFEHAVAPIGNARFIEKIQVPYNDVGYPSGPSTVDKVVQVSVVFRDHTTKIETRPVFCTAGAKVITHVWYETQYGTPYVSCQSSYD